MEKKHFIVFFSVIIVEIIIINRYFSSEKYGYTFEMYRNIFKEAIQNNFERSE